MVQLIITGCEVVILSKYCTFKRSLLVASVFRVSNITDFSLAVGVHWNLVDDYEQHKFLNYLNGIQLTVDFINRNRINSKLYNSHLMKWKVNNFVCSKLTLIFIRIFSINFKFRLSTKSFCVIGWGNSYY